MFKIKKVFSMSLVFVMLLSSNIVAFANNMNSTEDQVEYLIDYRAELLSLGKYNELENIDQRLEALGVEFLTNLEVQSKAIDTSNGIARVSTPVMENVTWMSSRTNYTYNGVTYEIQTLTAQPKNHNSNLIDLSNKAISSTYRWRAGAMNAISAIGMGALGEIPGASIYISVYNTLSSWLSGISPTTEISAADILYSVSNVTTATFKYVKVLGESDNRQSLTYISTKCVTAIGYQYPTLEYNDGSVTPNVIQGSQKLYTTPNGYNSNYNAVRAYNDVYSQTRACVSRVKITGIESKTVANIYPVYPQFPLHIQ